MAREQENKTQSSPNDPQSSNLALSGFELLPVVLSFTFFAEKNRSTERFLAQWRAGRDGSRCGFALRLPSSRRRRSDFGAENSPPDCFLFRASPSQGSSPFQRFSFLRFCRKKPSGFSQPLGAQWRAGRDSNPRPFGS